MAPPDTSSTPSDVLQELRASAKERGLEVWEGYPRTLSTVDWSGHEAGAFVSIAAHLGARVIYVGIIGTDECADAVVAGFVLEGVLHEFSCGSFGGEDGDDLLESDLNTSLSVGLASDPPQETPSSIYLPWDEREYQALDDDERAVIDALMDDVRYDPSGRWATEALMDLAGHLSDEGYARVRDLARQRYSRLIGRPMRERAEREAILITRAPGFDALSFDENRFDQTSTIGQDEDPRYARELRQQVSRLLWSTGLREQAMQRARESAREFLLGLPRLLQDRVYFASKNDARISLMRPHALNLTDIQLQRLAEMMPSVETISEKWLREDRYAGAARVLLGRGQSVTGASRALDISPSIVGRLIRDHPDPAPLEDDDPILAKIGEMLT